MEHVTIHLQGGEKVACLVDPTSPVLGDIFAAARNQPVSSRSLELQTPDGQIVSVSTAHITGLERDPSYCLVENVLSPDELEQVTTHAFTYEGEFGDSTLSLYDGSADDKPDSRFRRSRILNNVAALVPLIGAKLQRLMPSVWSRLRMAPIQLHSMECQITAHGDGDFFNTHTDNGLPEIAHRKISYVLYAHREPKQFSGGNLRLYRTLIAGGYNTCGAFAKDIEPPRNGMMIFPSHVHHEVTPIQCASAALADQRLTLNGWLV